MLESIRTLVVILMLSVLVHHPSAKLPTILISNPSVSGPARQAQAVPQGL